MNDSQTLPLEQSLPLSLTALCRALSRERLGSNSLPDDTDSTDALARYLWNGALAAAFYPALHALEVTLRNAIFQASVRQIDTTGRHVASIPCWLDAVPTLLYDKEYTALCAAKQRLPHDPARQTPGRSVARLGLGFWTGLCDSPYDHSRKTGPMLWPHLLATVFPRCPASLRTRPRIAHRLHLIRAYRNRIAHHDSLWDQPVLTWQEEILEVLSWMNPTVAVATRRCSALPPLVASGGIAFRSLAHRLIDGAPAR